MKPLATAAAVCATAALSLTSIGIAAAGPTATTRTFKACATSHGVLSILAKGKCARGTSAVTLGSTGPAGKNGQAGPAGATGPAGSAGAAGANGTNGTNGINGTRGPSDIYTAITAAASTLGGNAYTTVLTIPALPPGDYLVQAAVTVYNKGTDDAISCLIGTTHSTAQTMAGIAVLATRFYTGTAAVLSPLHLVAADDLILQCSSDNTSGGDPTKVAQATLSATLAGTLHATGGTTP